MGSPKLRIAILGTRGVPARYGGFETFAQELGSRLVTRGHSVSVYGRHSLFGRPDPLREHDGMELLSAPTIRHKYLETPLHSFFSFIDVWRRNFDVVLLCNAANSPFAWIGRLKGVPVAINVDGIERHRSKWNMLGRAWYRLGEICSVMFASRVIADAEVIARYYRKTYGAHSSCIAYGAASKHRPPGPVLSEFGLESNRYLLYVSRLEPENNALRVIQAYAKVETNMPLVIVGDAPYASQYKQALYEAADERVIFTGYRFGEEYQELQSHCYLYIQATEVGGTHPALIESMAYGHCIIANGTPENLEVLGGAGVFYQRNNVQDLAEQIERLVADPRLVSDYGVVARQRAGQYYDWTVITDQYENLLSEVACPSGASGAQVSLSKQER